MTQFPDHDFLQLCRMVLKGDRPADDFAIAVGKARENLANLKNDFLDHAEEGFPECNSVIDAFDAYAKGIDIVDEFLNSRDRDRLTFGMEKVRQAIEQLESALYRYDVWQLARSGPSDSPGYNLIAEAIHDYAEGEMPKEELEVALKSAKRAANRLLDTFASDFNFPEMQALKRAFDAHQNALQGMIDRLESKSPLDEPLQKFRQASALMTNVISAAQIRRLTDAPTPSRAANFLINTARECSLGTLSPKYFKEAVRLVKREHEHFKSQIQGQAIGKEALDLYLGALKGFEAAFKTNDIKTLTRLSQTLKSAVFQLYETLKPPS